MKTYNIKRLIAGRSISPEYDNKTLVAIPQNLTNGVIVWFNKSPLIMIDKSVKALTYRVFDDKFKRNKTYTLCYYEVKK